MVGVLGLSFELRYPTFDYGESVLGLSCEFSFLTFNYGGRHRTVCEFSFTRFHYGEHPSTEP
jgi:hypothetical protein